MPLLNLRFVTIKSSPGKSASALPRGLGHEMGNQLFHLFSLTLRAIELLLFIFPQTQHDAKFLLAFLTSKIVRRHAHPPFTMIPFWFSISYQPPHLVIKIEKRVTHTVVPEKGLLHVIQGPNVELEIPRKFRIEV